MSHVEYIIDSDRHPIDYSMIVGEDNIIGHLNDIYEGPVEYVTEAEHNKCLSIDNMARCESLGSVNGKIQYDKDFKHKGNYVELNCNPQPIVDTMKYLYDVKNDNIYRNSMLFMARRRKILIQSIIYNNIFLDYRWIYTSVLYSTIFALLYTGFGSIAFGFIYIIVMIVIGLFAAMITFTMTVFVWSAPTNMDIDYTDAALRLSNPEPYDDEIMYQLIEENLADVIKYNNDLHIVKIPKDTLGSFDITASNIIASKYMRRADNNINAMVIYQDKFTKLVFSVNYTIELSTIISYGGYDIFIVCRVFNKFGTVYKNKESIMHDITRCGLAEADDVIKDVLYDNDAFVTRQQITALQKHICRKQHD